MGEYLPDGTYQRYYAGICPTPGCNGTTQVNMQGQGRCAKCETKVDPMADLREKDR